ncbi:MAG: Gfo/Idh/MocA family oxidoreductase [Planctomycetota bacterium]
MGKEKKLIGIVGLGSMGRELCRNFEYITGNLVKTAAVVEPSDDNYQTGCRETSSRPARYATIEEMLAAVQLDGIVIAAPNHTHYGILRKLAGRQIPVLLEKPLDSTFDKICEIVRFCESYKGRVVVDHVCRYAPIIIKASRLIDSGEIGNICSFNFVQNCHYGNSMFRNFRRTTEGGGGMFIEKATHDFDILLYLLQARPKRIAAIAQRQAFGGNKPNNLTCSKCPEKLDCKDSTYNINSNYGFDKPMEAEGQEGCVYAQEIDVPDNEVCMIEFENGVFGTYSECYFSPSSYPTREYELIGLKGIMKISLTFEGNDNRGRILVCPRYGTRTDSYSFDFDYRSRIHYNGGLNVAKHFYHVMCGQAEPLTTVTQAFAAEILGYAAIQAAGENTFINCLDIIPDDLAAVWNNKWEKSYHSY